MKVKYLVPFGLQTQLVAKLEHARERVMQHRDALLVEGKIEDRHFNRMPLRVFSWDQAVMVQGRR